MMKFIYICMALLIISFVGIPVYHGIKGEHDRLQPRTIAATDIPDDGDISFVEIYAPTSGNNEAGELNAISPAAGNTVEDEFSQGFTNREDRALADTPEEISETAPEPTL